MRRGRLAKLRAGQLVPWSTPPFGYLPDPEHPATRPDCSAIRSARWSCSRSLPGTWSPRRPVPGGGPTHRRPAFRHRAGRAVEYAHRAQHPLQSRLYRHGLCQSGPGGRRAHPPNQRWTTGARKELIWARRRRIGSRSRSVITARACSLSTSETGHQSTHGRAQQPAARVSVACARKLRDLSVEHDGQGHAAGLPLIILCPADARMPGTGAGRSVFLALHPRAPPGRGASGRTCARS